MSENTLKLYIRYSSVLSSRSFNSDCISYNYEFEIC